MKSTLLITALAVAVSVEASCSSPGQACDTVKRAADAFANELQSSSRLPARSESGSETAFIARRQISELAFALAASQADPVAFYNALNFGHHEDDDTTAQKRDVQGTATTGNLAARVADAEPQGCTKYLGQPCWKKRDIEGTPTTRELAARVADAEPQGCTKYLGQPCWKKKRFEDRSSAVGVAVKRQPEAGSGWCSRFLGQPCWKRDAPPGEKREADGLCSRFQGQSCWKRDGSAAAAQEKKRCLSEGQSCWRAKRAAEAVINAIDEGNAHTVKRDADPACNAPDGACTRATRDLHAMYNAARNIIEA